MNGPDSTRRAFLAQLTALGATLGAGGSLLTACAEPEVSEPDTAEATSALLLTDIRAVLADIARDTLNGLTAFVVPGPDAYSLAQGTWQAQPGALAAKGTDFLIEAFDHFVPFPDSLARPVTTALSTVLSGQGFKLPLTLGSLLTGLITTVDGALQKLLQNNQTIPLSGVMALLLNLVAIRVNPLSVIGLFKSPFARLSHADKAKVFKTLEGPAPDLIALLDGNLPEPLKGSLSGLLRFMSGAMLELSAFGAYNEWGVFDKQTRTLTARPVGWQLSGYLPDGPVEGWNEFKGYYQGRTKAED